MAVLREAISLTKATYDAWRGHNAPRLAAALSYYTVFSIAPLLIVIVQLLGFFYHNQHAAIRAELSARMAHTIGASGAQAINAIVDATFKQQHAGIIAQIVGWAVFVLGAIGLFGALQDALNTIWDVEPKKHAGLLWMLRDRVASFGMVLAIAFLLLVSLGINASLTGFSGALAHVFPGFDLVMKIVDFAISLAVVTLLFALIFKFLPDTPIAWRDVWTGALITAVLFDLGQFVLGWYLGRAAVGSTYGAFGSLIVVLVWVNYASQILLFGAEFTHVRALKGQAATPRPLPADPVDPPYQRNLQGYAQP